MIFQNLKTIVWPVSVGGLREGGAGGFDWPWMLHATADALEATLEHMKVVEDMQRTLRDISNVSKLDSK